jgi:hypothetical protein
MPDEVDPDRRCSRDPAALTMPAAETVIDFDHFEEETCRRCCC